MEYLVDRSNKSDLLFGKTSEQVMANPTIYPPYKIALSRILPVLIPGQEFSEGITISIVKKKVLDEKDFRLIGRDRLLWDDIKKPGKSACISHTASVIVACLTMLNRGATEDDYLYTFPVAKIKSINFSVVYAPTRHHPLHVRFFPQEFDEYEDIPLGSRMDLAALLQDCQQPK